MKVTNLTSPVRLEWLLQQKARLDARPYVGGAHEARDLLKRLSSEPLRPLTAGLYNGPQFARTYVTSREDGVPFLGSADMLEADLSHLPLLSRSDAESDKLAYLRLEPGMTLISCSGTVGRVVYTRPAMAGIWSSQHMIKVVPNGERIRAGYLFAVLASRFGTTILVNSRSGTAIRELDPKIVAEMPIPRLDDSTETHIHNLVEEAARLRDSYQRDLVRATDDMFTSAGLADLIDPCWHDQPRDLGFAVDGTNLMTLRALNHGPRAASITEALRSVPHRSLGDICAGGTLRTGARFARVDADPSLGVRLIGQRQAFWMRPEGRWISPNRAPKDIRVSDETVLIAAHGTLGEGELYARSILVTGAWLRHAYSQDFVRTQSADEEFPGAYLFALLRSEAAFRLLRAASVGGKQQEFHPRRLQEFPVPLCSDADRARIAEIVRAAHRDRDLADQREDEAFALLETAVEGAEER